MQRPSPDECAPFYHGYLAKVPDGELLDVLRTTGAAFVAALGRVEPARGDFVYAPGKWSIKRVAQHVADGERLFAYRALCIARGDTQPLPGFDEDAYALQDGSEQRTLAAITAEFAAVRAATLALFEGLPATAAARRGTANGQSVTVRALAWMTAGHAIHHAGVLRERYGVG